MQKNYTIGLDIGTSSVGYAVLRDDYKLISKRMKVLGNTDIKSIKKNFWGVRLFEEGTTAEARRLNRTTRRRYTRRRKRIEKLQKIFFEEMAHIDSNFFIRLQDSFLVKEDKRAEIYPVFGTLAEEQAFHFEYPTIYHLRKKLVDSPEKADLRLIYLACAHILKYRGHFLIEGALDTKNSSVKELFSEFLREYNRIFSLQEDGSFINYLDESVEIESIIKEKSSRSKKAEEILALFPTEKKNGTLSQFIKMIVGLKANFQKVFDLEEKNQIEIPKDSFEEDISILLELIGEDYDDVFSISKKLYDAIVLSNILSVDNSLTKAKLSASMVQRYENHKIDLQKLKKFYKVHLPEEYDSMFKNDKEKGYAGYIDGHVTQEDFYQYLKKKIFGMNGAEYFIKKIEQEDLLRKQRSFDNGSIPHQIHLAELKGILENQTIHYPFIQNVQGEIEELFTFRIPYYIGPLAKNKENSPFAWLVRKTDEEITPRNIKEVVDYEASATKFIERMTNNDTYLPMEKVLPSKSLLYQRYTIFNELTKVSYIDDRGSVLNFSGEEKREIFNKLFKVERKVSKVKLEKFLADEYHIESPTVHGIEKNFNASYSTYHDLCKITGLKELLDNNENEDMFEVIVKTITLFEDRKMIENQLHQFSDCLSKKMIKELARKKYTGWGRFSEKLIHGIRDKKTNKTILDYLIEDDRTGKHTNRNLMQLINDSNLSFKSTIKKLQMIDEEKNIEDLVFSLSGSPAIKKGILQSIKIVDEIVDIMGYLPKNIVVEMARENQTTQSGKRNARPRLKGLEKAMKDFGSKLLSEHPVDNQALQTDRLYLYYLQNGRDMYTGEELDISNLSIYDIDHIIPQSFITDNSLDNRVLVSAKENREKSDNVPRLETVYRMEPFWNQLKKSKLISEKKYNNLTKELRGGLTEEDKANFIQRQLVETRQITKHVAQILDARFNITKNESGKRERIVNVVTLKSSLVSQFRKQFDIYKVREVNDYHHAHDAYLNGVVANKLLAVYPQLKPEFVYGEYLNYNSFATNKATAKKNFYSNIMLFFAADEIVTNDETGEIIWNKQTDIPKIKKVLQSKQMNIVKKVERQEGEFWNETIKSKGDSDKLIPIKKNLDTKKYGGYSNSLTSYLVVFTHESRRSKKVVKEIISIKLSESKDFEEKQEKFLIEKGFNNPKVIAKLPKYTLYESSGGVRRFVAGDDEAQKGNQLVLPQYLMTLLYHSSRYDSVKYKESYKYVNDNYSDYSQILDNVVLFSKKYIESDVKLEKIVNLYEENKNGNHKEVAKAFVNLMTFTSRGAPATFEFFDKKIERTRYRNYFKRLLNSTIIHQSITGMYETRINLEG